MDRGSNTGNHDGRPTGGEAERYRQLVNETPHCFSWEIDLATLRFTFVSAQAADLLGYPVEAWCGRDFWQDHIHPDDRKRVVDCCRSCSEAGGSHDLEYRMIAADGRVLWLRCLGSVVKDAAGRAVGLRGVMLDVTAKMLSERALQESEQRFRDFVGISSDWYWETDENDVYTWVSGNLQAATDVAPDWFVGKRLCDIAYPSMSPQVLKEHEQRLATHRPYRDFELRVNTPPGVRWIRFKGLPVFDDDGKFRGYRGSGTDITAQVEAEEETKRALVLFSGAIECIADGFALFDADDRFVTCNEMYRALVEDAASIVRPGVPFETFIRTAIKVGEIPDALDDEEAWLARRMEQHRNPQGPIEVRRKKLWLRIYERRTLDGGTVIVLTDITQEKQREEQLRQTQKMEAIGKLTGGIAHDFNNLLSVITSNIELLTDSLGDRADLQEMAEAVKRSCERGATLTRSLLAFARQQPLQPTSVEINRVVAEMSDLIRRVIPTSISVRIIESKDPWYCKADVGQLQNVLLNLVINARDAMPDGGELTIETAAIRIDEDEAAQQDDVEGGDYVMLAVSDSGTGMPPEVLARAFEPFFTSKPVGKGTGLGLSMVYGFAKQSGGYATIDSEAGRGTTVRVFLPRLCEVATEGASAP